MAGIGPAPEEVFKAKKPLNWETSEETLNMWLRYLQEICDFEKIDKKTLIEAIISAIGKERFCYLMVSKYQDDAESGPLLEWWVNNCDDGEPGEIFQTAWSKECGRK